MRYNIIHIVAMCNNKDDQNKDDYNKDDHNEATTLLTAKSFYTLKKIFIGKHIRVNSL